MVDINNDGIKLYLTDSEPIVYFDDWLTNLSMWGHCYDWIVDTMYSNGLDEEEVNEQMSSLEDDFYTYCDENGYIGETV